MVATAATLANTITVTSVAPQSCSFNGGCLLEIPQQGLTGPLLGNPSNVVRVCGQVCKVSTADSTPASTKCYLPPVATTYSIDSFTINKESYLMGVPFSSNS